MVRGKGGNGGGSASRAQAGRNRATPARLFKLYKEMSDAQRKLVSNVGFGSLLQIGSGRLPVGLSKWLVKFLDTDKEELVIPGRGKIKANAASVNRILGLPMGEYEVEYEFNGSAINFINEKCRFEDGRAPTIKSITERIAASKEANDDYLRCWLMVAISTFLCGSTALSISPKCYPSLVDLSKVKELNWCQFVVDTFKVSVGKMGKQDSFLGCHYFLAILYLDSLDIANIQVPKKQPRVAAWDIQLINKVIKMDTNRNGTFGKLKLKKLDGLVTETSLLGDLQDIDNFISHRAAATMSSKKKRKLSEFVRKACIGFTEVMGTFISEVSTISDDFEDQEERRRSTRRRTTSSHQHDVDVDEEIEDEEDEDWEDEVDTDARVTEEEEEEYEVDEEAELEDEGFSDEDDATEEVDIPADESKEPDNATEEVDIPADESKEPDNATEEVDIPADESKEPDNATEEVDILADESKEPNPVPLEVVPPQSRRQRLRLPPSTSVAEKSEKPEGHTKLDFSPPPIDIMSFIESPTPREHSPSNPIACSSERIARDYDDEFFWENLSEDQLQEINEQIDKVEAEKLQSTSAAQKPLLPVNTTIKDLERSRAQKLVSSSGAKKLLAPADTTIKAQERNKAQKGVFASSAKKALVPADTTTEDLQRNREQESLSGSAAKESAPSTSRTPAYQPAPRRPAQPGRFLRSPYIDYGRKELKCSKTASRAYDSVCSATRRSTRSSSQSSSQGDDIIISYLDYYVSLKHLSESVKPGGKLVNTVAEIAIYALNDRKAKIPSKHILPLRIASFLQAGILDNGEITSAFQRSPPHLDRSQLVMFPVLQNISFKRLDKTVGHYFLLVLNLREERFEVLDSMRSLADDNLRTCCNNLMTAIKELWHNHYPNSRKNIDNYQLIDIQVPSQSNNHDCGFHMLMHCEHWNGIQMPQFKEKDIPTIRKMLTYKCLSHPDNNIAWKCKMKFC